MLTTTSGALAATARFSRFYRIRNHEMNRVPPRVVDVQASPAQIEQLENEGYLLREKLLDDALLAELREAVDELEAHELQNRTPNQGGGCKLTRPAPGAGTV